MARPWKHCPKCGGEYPQGSFGRNVVRCITQRRPTCKLCEQTAGDAIKAARRWTIKVSETRRRHARRLNLPVITLERQYGWDLPRMARDAEHAYNDRCPGCTTPFKDMVHGLGDITLDIRDPEREPFLLTNTEWICVTCNRQKQRTPPEDWAEFCIGRELWLRQQVIGPSQKSFQFE